MLGNHLVAGRQEEEAASFPWLHPSPGSERGNFVHISCQGAINLQEVMVCIFPGNMALYSLLGLGLLQVSAVAIENSQHPLILLASPALLFICFLIKTFFVCVWVCVYQP